MARFLAVALLALTAATAVSAAGGRALLQAQADLNGEGKA
jgi:hypothetical protein